MTEKLRQERAKYEVTLTAAEALDETKKQLANLHPKEITEHCQRAIEAGLTNETIESKPKLNGINKLAENKIRLQCKLEE